MASNELREKWQDSHFDKDAPDRSTDALFCRHTRLNRQDQESDR
jgi:hypothetical protein